MKTQISIKRARDIDAPNARYVTLLRQTAEDSETITVHTDAQGHGLWVDGVQIAGLSQFRVGRDPSAAYRRYFDSIENK